ncbi:GNAT family N-acetyltransferase [Pseudalkalibacillus hwajinpoensis]|uniref:GNAT family N-acetyltransferase n=1 Tax=Guptibacillus hwajinpoensis TaxID=208199 RepID=UPI001CD3BBD9|nr:GNAT family N-acetyltransferase [Pseudalkalibacillus hwajinpoensis]MCA0992122.1 GNAT family N-acetyltransferase [Pseudalkalibacillus hwajinpoensis]
MLDFKTINLSKHRDVAIKFRKDSFLVSFGDLNEFGDENEYVKRLEEKIDEFPNGFVMVEKEGECIGQLELSVKEYEGRKIGYVNLYYLVPEFRGKGIGKELHQYASNFFTGNDLNEFHLRVSPSNSTALKFYHKLGMEKIGTELDGKVIRLRGFL